MLYSELKKDFSKISDIKVIPYLPILIKDAIIHGANSDTLFVDGLIFGCIKTVDGMKYINYTALKVAKLIMMIEFYTDIELDGEDTLYEIYDFFVSEQLDKAIREKICDLDEYNELIDLSIKQELEIGNSLASVVNNGIAQLLTRIPESKEIEKFLKTLPAMVNKIKPENLAFLKDIATIKKI